MELRLPCVSTVKARIFITNSLHAEPQLWEPSLMTSFVLDAVAPVSKHLWVYSNGSSLHIVVGFREAE